MCSTSSSSSAINSQSSSFHQSNKEEKEEGGDEEERRRRGGCISISPSQLALSSIHPQSNSFLLSSITHWTNSIVEEEDHYHHHQITNEEEKESKHQGRRKDDNKKEEEGCLGNFLFHLTTLQKSLHLNCSIHLSSLFTPPSSEPIIVFRYLGFRWDGAPATMFQDQEIVSINSEMLSERIFSNLHLLTNLDIEDKILYHGPEIHRINISESCIFDTTLLFLERGVFVLFPVIVCENSSMELVLAEEMIIVLVK